jgi:hypothetical protein
MELRRRCFSRIMSEEAILQVPEELPRYQDDNHQDDGGKSESLVRKRHHKIVVVL